MRQLTTRSGAQPKEKKTRKIPVKLKNVKKMKNRKSFSITNCHGVFAL